MKEGSLSWRKLVLYDCSLIYNVYSMMYIITHYGRGQAMGNQAIDG